MKTKFRTIFDRLFTGVSAFSAVLLTAILLIVLGPMIIKGSTAVFFRGTVEFRKLQRDEFNRGNNTELEKEIEPAEKTRRFVYEIIDSFKRGVDPQSLTDQVRQLNRQYGQELRSKGITGDDYRDLREAARQIRDKLEETFNSADKDLINENIGFVLELKKDERFKGTAVEEMFTIADDFGRAIEEIDLQKREKYAQSLAEVEDILFGSEQMPGLLGPKPGDKLPQTIRLRYGATRWDVAKKLLNDLLYPVQWVEIENGKPLVPQRHSRAEEFEGTRLEPLFAYIENELPEMLKPKLTFYWQYFVDKSIDSHYFGGVGPEILGTILLTITAMIFVIPLGVISAAFLVECSANNLIIKIIRMCINTLAGVPSIVFGLFGLAFFVLYFLPAFGAGPKGSILAASLTLAVLTLPLMIRASEEAIRSVPQTYKEASLALGAGSFKTFVKVTLPAALPGILTGIILSLSRVAGETAPVLFTGAVAMGTLPRSILDPTMTLSYGSYNIATGDNIGMQVPHKQFGMIVTLVLLILLLNAAAILLRSRISKKLKGMR